MGRDKNNHKGNNDNAPSWQSDLSDNVSSGRSGTPHPTGIPGSSGSSGSPRPTVSTGNSGSSRDSRDSSGSGGNNISDGFSSPGNPGSPGSPDTPDIPGGSGSPPPKESGATSHGLFFIILSVILLLVLVASLFTGTVQIPLPEIARILAGGEASRPEWEIIIREIRLPRTITALIAGTGLSVSGLLMQTVFRNPLAGPYVLGISAGGSLGVAAVVMGLAFITGHGGYSVPGNWTLVIASWTGSALVLVLILLVSFRVRDIMTILILGIMFGSATGALVSIMQYFSTEAMLKSFMIWTMGSLGGVTSSQLRIMVPVVVFGILLSLASVKLLNAMLLGENYARSLGMNVTIARILVFFSTSILAGTITAFCGPVAFIGIAVPHLSRMLFRNADHAVLMPATILIGGIVMITSDIAAQLPGLDSSLPINSVTALLGIPVVIWIVIRNQKLTGIF